jgi:homoserine O-acetyltransferase/O-succinyltransferase
LFVFDIKKMVKHEVFKSEKAFQLENGAWLPELEIAYTTYGTRNSDDSNIVWICHAFTGNANPADWWNGLVGDKRYFNPSEHFIVCANVIGSHYGSTNALSKNPDTGKPYYHDFPFITIRDVVQSLILLRKHLEINTIEYIIGGSLGGQQAIEWTATEPEIFKKQILFSTNAVHSPWGIAFNESQRMAIAADPTWLTQNPEAGYEGMKVARSIALLSYRNYGTYNKTQSRDAGQVDFFRANTYQNYQGEKLQRRFNAFSYWTLSKMFDSHDVSRNRRNLAEALQLITAKTLVIGISSDILFPPVEQETLGRLIPNATFKEIESGYGHDGFLIEFDVMRKVIGEWEGV